MTHPRRVLALAVGLVVSTLLLGGGWLASTWRERATRLREAEARLLRTAHVVRGAVDESLEELRAREDERPFYHYGYYYSPPDVLAISDPVAISPLARPPTDPRVVGYFQIDPGGAIRTPYTPDAEGPAHPLSTRVRGALESEALASLRALASPPRAPAAPLARAAPPIEVETSLLTLSIGDAPAHRGPSPAASPETVAIAQVERSVDLNTYGNVQAQDIQLAQQGDPMASQRVLDRGRQVPNYSRRNVTWEDARQSQQQPQAPPRAPAQARSQPATAPVVASPVATEAPLGAGSRMRRPSAAQVRAALDAHRDAVVACAPGRDVVVRLRVRGEDGAPSGVNVSGVDDPEAVRCVRDALAVVRLPPFEARVLVVGYLYAPARAAPPPELADASGLDNMVRRAAEVDYTPMTYAELGDALVLHRLVTHEGVSVVQGVLLARDRLAGEWIARIVARHAGETEPAVVEAGQGECAVREPASAIVGGVELCFPPAALRAATEALDRELGWQLAALLALLSIALLAAAAIVIAARRAQALSRQKSEFVSAVSHELRTPLTTLRMHAEMLDEGLVTDARRPKVHKELVRESVRLARLVDNVLTLARIEEGRRRIEAADGDLAAHVREVAEGQRGLVEERGFTLDVRAGAPLEACFDRQAVEQIVVNLLDNALKYGAGAERAIEVRVEAPSTIVVSDRGPGVPVSARERVFERFYRVERPEHAHAPGTGIGLSLVADLAVAHGGRASVHPREGGGLEVRVALGGARPEAPG
ncbi:MAG: HAMP domain-containing histidine kinase [Sandaracinaceae bacterium]|nr:HAMP domain-containing histidine kinase [Sandaracinaceae bacterium]